jgi:uncharacterized membrane protein
MLGSESLYFFRFVQVVAGVMWVGAAVFVAFFLLPGIRAIGPAGGPIMEHLTTVKRFPLYMMGLAILTVLSGLGLYWHDSSNFDGAFMHSGPGATFGAGGLLAIVVVILGMTVVSPATKRLGALAGSMKGAGGPPKPEVLAELQSLQARTARFTSIVAVLLLIATTLMAVARYVP